MFFDREPPSCKNKAYETISRGGKSVRPDGNIPRFPTGYTGNVFKRRFFDVIILKAGKTADPPYGAPSVSSATSRATAKITLCNSHNTARKTFAGRYTPRVAATQRTATGRVGRVVLHYGLILDCGYFLPPAQHIRGGGRVGGEGESLAAGCSRRFRDRPNAADNDRNGVVVDVVFFHPANDRFSFLRRQQN